jgi:hypothetical protein
MPLTLFKNDETFPNETTKTVILQDANEILECCLYRLDCPVELRMIIISYQYAPFLYHDIKFLVNLGYKIAVQDRLARHSIRMLAHDLASEGVDCVPVVTLSGELNTGYHRFHRIEEKRFVPSPIWIDERVLERKLLQALEMPETEADDKLINYDPYDPKLCRGRCFRYFETTELQTLSLVDRDITNLCSECVAFYVFRFINKLKK